MELLVVCSVSALVTFAFGTVVLVVTHPEGPRDVSKSSWRRYWTSPFWGPLLVLLMYFAVPDAPDDALCAQIITQTEDYELEISGIYLELSQNDVVVFPSAIRRKSIKAWEDKENAKENAKETAKEDAAKKIRNELKLEMINQLENKNVQ